MMPDLNLDSDDWQPRLLRGRERGFRSLARGAFGGALLAVLALGLASVEPELADAQVPGLGGPFASVQANANFVGVSTPSGTGISASSFNNGSNWSTVPIGNNSTWMDVADNGTILCAISGNGTASTVAASSTNGGRSWTLRTVAVASGYTSITWDGADFFIIGEENGAQTGTIAGSSPDCVTWTGRTMPTNTRWQVAKAVGNTIIAAGGVNTVAQFSQAAVSTDHGASWTFHPIGATLPIGAMGTNGTVVVLPGGWTQLSGNNVFVRSTNGGSTWTTTTVPSTYSWGGIAFNGPGGTLACAVAGGYINTNGQTLAARSNDSGQTWASSAMPSGVAFGSIQWSTTSQNFITVQGNTSVSAGTIGAMTPDCSVWTTFTFPSPAFTRLTPHRALNGG